MLENIKKAYFVGIKGVGMTSFAQILQHKGVEVVGSDTNEVFFTDAILNSLNISFFENFDARNLARCLPVDVVIASPAYLNSDNAEIQEAKKRNIPVLSWHQGLAQMFNAHYGVAVCGTHGKSTTTAMLGTILDKAGFNPTVVVGSRVNEWGSNARVGDSEYYVIEADEYKDSFLQYDPKIVAITNIEYDHPDYFQTKDQYLESFQTFQNKPSVEKVVKTPTDVADPIPLSVFGEYNQQNARLALQVAQEIGVEKQVAVNALQEFQGIARRCELYGEYNGALLYDDYAHHPTEITALYNGLRSKFFDRAIIFLFQPHTFSRTKALFDEFVGALRELDKVAILYSYASARENEEDVAGQNLAQALNAPYFSSHEQAIKHFQNTLQKNDLLCCVGAGDGWRVAEALRASTLQIN